MEPLIRFEKISKQFEKEVVLKGLDLDIYPHEIFGLVGKSGAGKSTLLRILMGFFPQDSGKIYFRGLDITGKIKLLRQSIGLTTQENSFYGKLTVKENLVYYGRMYGLNRDVIIERIPTLLELVKLKGHSHTIADDLSGGMKRRLDFAISLIHDPQLLILDEPTTGLDPLLRKSMWEIIHDIRNYGKTIIVSSHFFEELQKNATRIGVLNNKRMICAAPFDWYKQSYQKEHLTEIFEELILYDDKNA